MAAGARYRRSLVVLVTAVLVGSHLVTGSPVPAVANGDVDPAPADQSVLAEGEVREGEVYEHQEAQGRLVEVAHRIFELVDPTEGAENVTGDGAEYGYAGLSIDPPSRTLTLYWVGKIEATIQEILDDRHPSVLVEIIPSEFTLFEMQDAARALVGDYLRARDETSLHLALAGPRTEGDGIVAEYYVEGARREAEYDLAALIERTTRISGVPVFLVEVPGPNEELVERQQDFSPYDGGAGYRNVNTGSYCSTGFGVRSRSTGNTYLLTAHHCFRGGTGDVGARRPGQGGAEWGFWRNVVTRNAPAYDATLLQNHSGSISSSIFYGPIRSSTRAPMTGTGFSTVGEYLCVGGANSGTTCSIRVISKNDFVVVSGGGVTLKSVARGLRQDGAVAVVRGDSGGPVYSTVYSAEGGARSARGIVVQGWGAYRESCSGVVMYEPTSFCYSGFIWTGIRSTLDALNMDLMTG